MNSQCPECRNPITAKMIACANCGHPLVQSPSSGVRLPLFQYGAVAFAVPFSLSGVSMALRMQGIAVSDAVLGIGTMLGAVIAVCLAIASFIDRTYLNRGKPAGSLKLLSWFTVVALLVGVVWLLLAIIAAQAGFKLE